MTHEWKVPENLQRSMSFLRKFTWTLLHAPPHPTPPHLTRAYMHLPAATDKHVLPPQVHMNVITCPTPPQTRPTPPPRCVQKAVVQLVLVVYLCNKVLRGPQLQSCQGTHEKSLDSRHLILAKWRMPLRSRSVWVYYIQLIIINNYDYKIYIDRKGHCIIYIYIHLSSFWYGVWPYHGSPLPLWCGWAGSRGGGWIWSIYKE